MRIATNQAELIEHTGRILGLVIQGEKTESVLLSEKTEIARELYAGVTFDPQNGLPVLMFSTSGGMDIEEVARTTPEKVLTMHLPPTQPVRGFRIIDFLRGSGLPSELLPKLAQVMQKLIEAFHGSDATTAEINPLVVTPQGGDRGHRFQDGDRRLLAGPAADHAALRGQARRWRRGPGRRA